MLKLQIEQKLITKKVERAIKLSLWDWLCKSKLMSAGTVCSLPDWVETLLQTISDDEWKQKFRSYAL